MASQSLTIKLPEGEYEFSADKHLTRLVLSHFKSWYGADYATYWSFQQKLLMGDGDAVACAIWAVRRANGFTPNPDPTHMPDFSIGDVFIQQNLDDEAEATDPAPLANPTPSAVNGSSSEEILTTSGISISESSATSVTSPPLS
jgi:hypothetical protein